MSMRTVLAALAFLACSTSVARADSPDVTDGSSPEGRDPRLATLIAASGPIIGLGMTMGSLASSVGRPPSEHASNAVPAIGLGLVVVTPTLAHIYTGDVWNTGFKIKLVGAVVASIGGGAMLGEGGNADEAAPYVALGLGAVVVGTIWEMSTATSSAEAFNERRASRLALTPVVHGDGASVILGGAF